MFTSYKYLHGHTLENLHNYIKFFFEQMFARSGKRYSKKVIHDNFKVIIDHCPKLDSLLRTIYKEYNKLDYLEKTLIQEAFFINNQIEELCRGNLEPIHYSDLPSSFAKICYELFKYLYESLPNTDVFQENMGTFLDHYQKLRELNNTIIMCPSCGVSYMKPINYLKRNDYDHYLPKSIYPFSSVNFNNLLPICDDCNSDEKKAQDTLYIEKNKKSRRKVFYPYDSNIISGHIQVRLLGSDPDNLSINLEGNDEQKEEIQSWDKLFSISSRYLAITKERQGGWMLDLQRKYKKQREKPNFDFKQFLDDEFEDMCANLFLDRVFLKKALYDWLCSNPDLERDLELSVM